MVADLHHAKDFISAASLCIFTTTEERFTVNESKPTLCGKAVEMNGK